MRLKLNEEVFYQLQITVQMILLEAAWHKGKRVGLKLDKPDFKSSATDLKFLISDLNTQLPRLKTNSPFRSSHG